MSILAYIIVFSLASGLLALIGGIALLMRETLVRRFSVHLVSFAVGDLLATALLDLLPEAFELGEEAAIEPHFLGWFILAGIVGFFVLESLIFKFHHYHNEDETAEHHHAAPTLLAIGDTVHNFIDGVLIAGAFLVDVPLGIVTALAVAAHELPQEIGDFSVMLHHGWSRARILKINIFSSLASVAGAVITFFARDFIEPYLPHLLALTAGVFVYIAAANLLPELSPHHKTDKRSHIIVLILLGIFAVWLFASGLIGPAH